MCESDEAAGQDVAACPFNAAAFQNEGLEPDIVSLRLNGKGSVIPTEEWSESKIGLGSDVAIVGLFRSHYGRERNVPIIRVGNIAALPGERVLTSVKTHVEAYLIEARSVAGLSGSPVLAIAGTSWAIRSVAKREPAPMSSALLGLMHGHFDVQDVNEDVVTETANEATTGIHTGIGVVIPTQKIVETIEHPKPAKQRREVSKLSGKTEQPGLGGSNRGLVRKSV